MTDRTVRVRVTANNSDFDRAMYGSAAATDSLSSRLAAADSRMAALVQTGLAVAPALVPIGAAAIPAVAGLSAELGFAALAAGTAVLAFQGVGDALKAVDKFQLEPTQANLQKVRETLGALSPAAGDFVLQLDQLEPRLQHLKMLAASGLFPGVDKGLDELLTRLPDVRQLLTIISSVSGNLAAEAGQGLASNRFNAFFDYLKSDATPILENFGRTIGNFVEGTANIFVAFDPLERDFSSGLLDASRSFAAWTRGLDETEGFQKFVDYIRQSGPEVVDTLESVGGALVDVTEAAAPVGPAALAGLRLLADIVGAIANSPGGPALISLASAVGVYARSLKVLEAVGLRGDASKGGVLARSFQNVTGPISSARRELISVTSAQDRARMSATQLADAEQRRFSQIRAGVVRSAQIGGLIAVAGTDVADKMGLANTATLGLAGSMIGPWAGAAGATLGMLKDLAERNDDLEAAQRRVNASTNAQSINLQEQADAIAQLGNASDATYKQLTSYNPLTALGTGLDAIRTFGGNYREAFGAQDQHQAAAIALQHETGAIVDLVDAVDPARAEHMRNFGYTLQDLQDVLAKVGPAAQIAGVDLHEAISQGADSEPFQRLVAAIRDYNRESGTTAGQSQAVANALAGMSSELETTGDKADALKASLDALFGIQINRVEAVDNWTRSLQELRKALSANGGALRGNSDAALNNRAAVIKSVEALETRINADAQAGASSARLARDLREGRQAIVDQAVAAGASRPVVLAFLKTLNLTPKIIKTIIGVETAQALGAIATVKQALASIPHSVGVTVGGIHKGSYADGGSVFTGRVTGPGGPRDDRVPAMLSHGEFVIPTAAVQRYGVGFFEAARRQRLADGGFLTRPVATSRVSSTTNYYSSGSDTSAMRALKTELAKLRETVAGLGTDVYDGARDGTAGRVGRTANRRRPGG